VTVVVIPNASHAEIAERPDAVSEALIDYARKVWG
jgi:pimeloyl-ACP methyl ester carboxylesterase